MLALFVLARLISSGVAIAVGPLVGGAIVEGVAWNWIFWVNVPIGIALGNGGKNRFVEATGKQFRLTAVNKLEFFNGQTFPREKARGHYRIFCVGGSTTYGRPYDDKTSFSGWLRELLPMVDSGRDWEVINAGGISYASYRVAMLMEREALSRSRASVSSIV